MHGRGRSVFGRWCNAVPTVKRREERYGAEPSRVATARALASTRRHACRPQLARYPSPLLAQNQLSASAGVGGGVRLRVGDAFRRRGRCAGSTDESDTGTLVHPACIVGVGRLRHGWSAIFRLPPDFDFPPQWGHVAPLMARCQLLAYLTGGKWLTGKQLYESAE